MTLARERRVPRARSRRTCGSGRQRRGARWSNRWRLDADRHSRSRDESSDDFDDQEKDDSRHGRARKRQHQRAYPGGRQSTGAGAVRFRGVLAGGRRG